MKKWYVVYTKGEAEKKVVEQLTKNGFETYCPFQPSRRIWGSMRKKAGLEPVFPNYVFVRVMLEEHSQVKSLSNVLAFVYWLGNPVEVRNIEIEMIQRFLYEHKNVLVETTDVMAGEIVKLISDPGFIEEQNDIMFIKTQTQKLSLPSIGRIMTAEAQGTIKKLNSATTFPISQENFKYGIK